MMKYQAEVMAREGRMLEIKAQMCEEQEIEAQIHETEQEMAYSRPTQMFRSHPVTIATTTIIEDHHRQTTIKERERFPYNCENFNGIEVVREQEGTSAYEEEQKVFMKKDIKTLTEIVNENPNNSQSLDPQIFKSSVFKEADKLIAGNFHFNSLLKAVGQEIQIQEKIIKEDIKEDLDNKSIEDMPLNLSKPYLEIREPEFHFTNEEMNWIGQMDQNLQRSLKVFVRPEFFRAVVNIRLGKISLMEFSRVMMAGRPARTYCILMIMSNLPYFKDLTSQSVDFQQNLKKLTMLFLALKDT